jgi:hypothetical protein
MNAPPGVAFFNSARRALSGVAPGRIDESKARPQLIGPTSQALSLAAEAPCFDDSEASSAVTEDVPLSLDRERVAAKSNNSA